MADTCYGEPDTGQSERSTLVADGAGDAARPDAAPVEAPPSPVAEQPSPAAEQSSPVAEQPSAARRADGHAAPTAPVETAAELSTPAPSSAASSGPAAEAAEPRLALEQMTPVIDGGVLMVFGPESDPVPPQAFVDAAVSRPDLLLRLPDGTAVRADRIATVLDAQRLGRLGADEQSDAWILMMLGQGDRPEPASDDALHAEQGDPEPAAQDILQVDELPVEAPGADVGAEAGAVAACDSVAKDPAPLDQAPPDPIVGTNQDALPQVELDLDSLAAITDASLDFELDLDLDFPTEGLAFPTEGLDGEADDRSGVANRRGARDDTSPAMTDRPNGQIGGHEMPHQSPEAAPPAPPGTGPIGHATRPGGGATAGPITEDGARHGLPGEAYLTDDGPDAGGAAIEGLEDVGTVEAVEHNTDPKQRDNAVRRAAAGPSGWPEAESEPAVTPAQAVSGQVDVDPDSIALVVIRGVPEDATLSTGTRDEDGSWSISPLDLASVVISLPAEDRDHGAGGEPRVVEGDLDITGIAFTEHGELVAISETVPLADYVAESPSGPARTIEPADPPAAAPVVAPNPRMIALDIDPGVWAGEQFDALVVRDLPPGARLSAGSYDPSIDGWVLMLQDLPTLAIAPPAGLSADFSLTLMGVALRPGDGNAARVLARLPVTLG